MAIRRPDKSTTVYHALDKDIRNPKGGRAVSSINNNITTNEISRLTFTTGEEISANMAVCVISNIAYLADNLVSNEKPAHGVSRDFAESGGIVTLYNQYEIAECDSAFTGFVLAGSEGDLLDVLATPENRYLQRLGRVVSAGKFIVNIENPIRII
jgi:hypothetical protein